jgi:hypothetical protein
VCTEASIVLRAVAADFFFTCWCSEILSDNRGSRTTDLCSINPDRFEYCFIYETLVACGGF